MGKFIDLTGHKFGRLTVIERVGNDRYENAQWLCQCECGGQKITTSGKLNSNNTRSCGCYGRGQRNLARRLKAGNPAANIVISHYKNNARRRGYEFRLTNEECLFLFKSNCARCGRPPSNTMLTNNNTDSYKYNGIDRRDNNKGYTIDNCVSCCKDCNKAKSDRDENEYNSWLLRAASFLIRNKSDRDIIKDKFPHLINDLEEYERSVKK